MTMGLIEKKAVCELEHGNVKNIVAKKTELKDDVPYVNLPESIVLTFPDLYILPILGSHPCRPRRTTGRAGRMARKMRSSVHLNQQS
jgi:hypothetical protein